MRGAALALLASGGCALVYGYGDYDTASATTAGGGGEAGASTTSSGGGGTGASGGSGGATTGGGSGADGGGGGEPCSGEIDCYQGSGAEVAKAPCGATCLPGEWSYCECGPNSAFGPFAIAEPPSGSADKLAQITVAADASFEVLNLSWDNDSLDCYAPTTQCDPAMVTTCAGLRLHRWTFTPDQLAAGSHTITITHGACGLGSELISFFYTQP